MFEAFLEEVKSSRRRAHLFASVVVPWPSALFANVALGVLTAETEWLLLQMGTSMIMTLVPMRSVLDAPEVQVVIWARIQALAVRCARNWMVVLSHHGCSHRQAPVAELRERRKLRNSSSIQCGVDTPKTKTIVCIQGAKSELDASGARCSLSSGPWLRAARRFILV